MGQQEGGESASVAARPISGRVVAEVLRGVAQVDFMPSVVCGLFFVAIAAFLEAFRKVSA
ncbi:hypothetical protein ACIQOW_16435 [Kitasatospora sp. NPDC091335]|uniref:hypothetical protein n=1 Tax=Kitasatospora sp. NPDC091335 TaxID=3364085 RepID=UPI003802D6D1